MDVGRSGRRRSGGSVGAVSATRMSRVGCLEAQRSTRSPRYASARSRSPPKLVHKRVPTRLAQRLLTVPFTIGPRGAHMPIRFRTVVALSGVLVVLACTARDERRHAATTKDSARPKAAPLRFTDGGVRVFGRALGDTSDPEPGRIDRDASHR